MRMGGAGAGRRLLVAILVAGAAGAAVAGCGSSLRDEQSGGDSSQTQAAGARPITMAGVFCVCFTGAYVAWKKGFFEEEGVPLKKYVATKAGSDTFQALAGGDVDFGLSGLDAVIRGQEKGIGVKAIATVSPEFYALSVRDDLAGEIRGPADLKGRKVAISKIGSASWAFLQFLAGKAGLKEGDVKVVQLGGIDTIVAGLKSKRVDAAITWEPGTAQVRDMHIATPVINALEPADHRELFGGPSSIGMTLATRDELVQRDPELLKRTVRALGKAYAWIGAHSAAEVAAVIAPLAPGLDRRVLTDAVADTIAAQPKTPAISAAAYATSARILHEAGVIESVPPLDKPVSCAFATCSK